MDNIMFVWVFSFKTFANQSQQNYSSQQQMCGKLARNKIFLEAEKKAHPDESIYRLRSYFCRSDSEGKNRRKIKQKYFIGYCEGKGGHTVAF